MSLANVFDMESRFIDEIVIAHIHTQNVPNLNIEMYNSITNPMENIETSGKCKISQLQLVFGSSYFMLAFSQRRFLERYITGRIIAYNKN